MADEHHLTGREERSLRVGINQQMPCVNVVQRSELYSLARRGTESEYKEATAVRQKMRVAMAGLIWQQTRSLDRRPSTGWYAI